MGAIAFNQSLVLLQSLQQLTRAAALFALGHFFESFNFQSECNLGYKCVISFFLQWLVHSADEKPVSGAGQAKSRLEFRGTWQVGKCYYLMKCTAGNGKFFLKSWERMLQHFLGGCRILMFDIHFWKMIFKARACCLFFENVHLPFLISNSMCHDAFAWYTT